jgi:hypothetical protein
MRQAAQFVLAVLGGLLAAWLACMCSGCSTWPLPTPSEERAAIEVVRAAARDVGLELPEVVAIGYSAQRVTCAGHDGDFAGCSYARAKRCDVLMEWAGSFAESAFPHEMLHCEIGAMGMDDQTHTVFEWNVLEPRLRAALREAGL